MIPTPTGRCAQLQRVQCPHTRVFRPFQVKPIIPSLLWADAKDIEGRDIVSHRQYGPRISRAFRQRRIKEKSLPKLRRVNHPIMLGIVGDSASGKTTLARGITQILGPDRVVHLGTDNYHRFSREERRASGVSALQPDANYVDIIEQHMRLLRRGEPVLMPVYDHRYGTLERPNYVQPKDYIIVEGLLAHATRGLRDCFDVKLYLDPQEDLRTRWKIQRDCFSRNYTEEEVRHSLDKRQPHAEQYIQPQRSFADMVVQFYPPEDHESEQGAKLNVRHILRPTLPHPDLRPLLDIGTRSGIRLELQRDMDQKPVDILEIPGILDDRQALEMEELLWSLIPEAQHLRANLGSFDDETNHRSTSHPLALSQLLVAYHMVKAALGHHNV